MLFLGTLLLFIVLAFVFKNKKKPKPVTYPLIEKGDLYPGARKIDDWYAIANIDSETIVISEQNSVEYNNAFLLLGSEKALLIDVGSGNRPKSNPKTLIDVAKQLTQLPIEVILTHFHCDHIGDIDKVDALYMIDLPYLRKRAKNDVLKLRLSEALKPGKILLNIHTWVPDGGTINLGNREITIKHTPGHSPESICLFDKQRKQVILGDCLYTHPAGIVTFVPNGNEVLLADSWDIVMAEIDEDYTLLGSHGAPVNSWNWALKNQRLLHNIRAGKIPYRWDFFWPVPIPSRVYYEEDLKLSGSLVRGLSLLHYPILIIVVIAILTLAYQFS